MGLRRAWHARFVRRSALARSRRRGSRVVRSCAFFFVRYFVFVRSFSTFRSLARSLAAPCPTGWQISQNSCAWSLHRYAPPHLLSLSLLCLQSVYGTPRVLSSQTWPLRMQPLIGDTGHARHDFQPRGVPCSPPALRGGRVAPRKPGRAVRAHIAAGRPPHRRLPPAVQA